MPETPTKPQIYARMYRLETMFDPDRHPLDESWPTEQEGPEVFDHFAERYISWKRDEWHYLGIQAVADIHILSHIDDRGNTVTVSIGHLASPGIWGVESTDPDYIRELYWDEKQQLIDQLEELGIHEHPDAIDLLGPYAP